MPSFPLTGVAAGIRTLQRATSTIPIVLAYSTDPVGNGYVTSLARPGGNITGLAGSSDDTSPKQLELVATVVPNVSRMSARQSRQPELYGRPQKRAERRSEGRPNRSAGRSARSAGDRDRVRCIRQRARAGIHWGRRCSFLWTATADRGIGAQTPSPVDILAA